MRLRYLPRGLLLTALRIKPRKLQSTCGSSWGKGDQRHLPEMHKEAEGVGQVRRLRKMDVYLPVVLHTLPKQRMQKPLLHHMCSTPGQAMTMTLPLSWRAVAY